MLALLTRQRDMLKTEAFFNTFRKHVASITSRGQLADQRHTRHKPQKTSKNAGFVEDFAA
jgi:hypothetical protein